MKIIILSSSSRHFPLDIQATLKEAGQESHRLESLNEFISSPLRREPFLAILEVGATEDIDRALVAYEWAETVQPLAPARYLLLLGSKHISLNEKSSRFRGVEIAPLPLPAKNLLFKIDLQLRVLSSEMKTEKKTVGFSAEIREVERERVFVIKGPGPQIGAWKNGGEAPQGRIRWRWIDNSPKKEKIEANFSWTTEAKTAPVFNPQLDQWEVKDPEADLQCHRDGKEIFSAKKSGLSEGSMTEDAAQTAESAHKSPAAAVNVGVEERNTSSFQASSPEKNNLISADSRPQESSANPSQSTPATNDLSVKAEPKVDTTARAAVSSEKASVPSATKKESPAPSPSAAHSSSSQASAPKAITPTVPSAKEKQVSAEELPTSAKPATIVPAMKATASTGPVEPQPSSIPNSPPKPASSSPQAPQASKSQAVPPTSESPSRPTKEPTEKEAALKPAAGPTNAAAVEAPKQQPAKQLAPEQVQSALGEKRQNQDHPARAVSSAPAAPDSAEKLASMGEQTAREIKVHSSLGTTQSSEIRKKEMPQTETPKREKHTIDPGVETSQSRRTETIVTQESAPAEEGIDQSADFPEKTREITGKILIPKGPERSDHQNLIRASAPSESGGEMKTISSPGQEAASDHQVKTRLFLTLTLEELQDQNSTWMPVEGYRIYLSARHRYYGIKDIDEVFPLWVYEGELAPQFLDLQKAWKFYDRLPVSYGGAEDLPPPVRAYLQGYKGEAPDEIKGSAEGSAKPAESAESNTVFQTDKKPKPKPKPGVFSAAWFLELLSRVMGR